MTKVETEGGDEVVVFEDEPDYPHSQATAEGVQDELEEDVDA